MNAETLEKLRRHVHQFGEDARDEFEERAAIIEYSVPGTTRSMAEVAAYYRVCHRHKLTPVVERQTALWE